VFPVFNCRCGNNNMGNPLLPDVLMNAMALLLVILNVSITVHAYKGFYLIAYTL
jgi:hypothetical protein